jgi:hypothetical protein
MLRCGSKYALRVALGKVTLRLMGICGIEEISDFRGDSDGRTVFEGILPGVVRDERCE